LDCKGSKKLGNGNFFLLFSSSYLIGSWGVAHYLPFDSGCMSKLKADIKQQIATNGGTRAN
jgi:hypothetical protein